MASMESMLRNINRQLEQHARIFGQDSETYKNFVHDIERELGKANYTQRSGAVGYSRSIPMTYKYEDVKRANEKSKGQNTAAAKWSKAAFEAAENITEDEVLTEKDVLRYQKIKEELERNFELIYQYMQEEFDDFYSEDFSRLNPDTFDDSILKHTMKTTKYNTLEEVEKLIRKAKRKAQNVKKEIKQEAQKTKGAKLTKKEIERTYRKRRKDFREAYKEKKEKENGER